MTEFAEEKEAAAYRSSFHKRTFDAIDLDADDELYDPITHIHPSSTRKRTVEDDDEFIKSKPQGPSEKLTERKKTKKGKEKKKAKAKR